MLLCITFCHTCDSHITSCHICYIYHDFYVFPPHFLFPLMHAAQYEWWNHAKQKKKKIILLCTTTKQDYLWVIQHWNDKRHECCLRSSVVVLFCFGDNISLEAFPMYLHFAVIISLAQFSPCPGYNSKQRDVCWGRQFLRILCALIMLVSPFLSIMSSEFLKVLGNLLHNSVNKTQNLLSDLIGSVFIVLDLELNSVIRQNSRNSMSWQWSLVWILDQSTTGQLQKGKILFGFFLNLFFSEFG